MGANTPRHYEIIATLGPASEAGSTWREMLTAGATAFRLNTSHLTLPQLLTWLERLEPFLSAWGSPLPVVLDLQGSKWRLGEFTSFDLAPGQTVRLACAASAAEAGILPVPHPEFFDDAAASNGEIVLDDAKIRLKMKASDPDWITAQVVAGGAISPRKGITCCGADSALCGPSARDRAIWERTQHLGFIRYALSYLRDAQELSAYRAAFGGGAYLIAKLERRSALADASQISAGAQEMWLCRGDLGAEVGLAAMGAAAHQFSSNVRRFPVAVMLAGQVLEHMTTHPTPTRAEVCALHDALAAGYRGVVLSDETAIGRHPVESCAAAALYRNEGEGLGPMKSYPDFLSSNPRCSA